MNRSLRSLAVLLAATALASCSQPVTDVTAERARLTREAADAVSQRLTLALAKAHLAIERVGRLGERRSGPAAPAGSAPAGRADEQRRLLDDLERVRSETGVDGVLSDDPSGDRLWAGNPIEPRELPAAKPWDESFAAGDVVFHAGPFLRALIVSGPGPRGGTARATVRLADDDASPLDGTVEKRWASARHVRSIRILPASSLGAPLDLDTLRVGVPIGAQAPSLAVEVVAPDPALVRSLADERQRHETGLRWLLFGGGAVLLAAIALARRLKDRAARSAALIVGVVSVRQGLLAIDLPSRFRAWAPAFQGTDFGLTGFGGWLATPADLALSGTAILVVAVAASFLLGLAAGRSGPPSRGRRFAVGSIALLLSAIAVSGWLQLVEEAAIQARVDVFGAGSLFPSLSRTLLLVGLCASTAATFVLCRSALRCIEAACPSLPRAAPRLLGAAVISALALVMPGDSYPVWTHLLVPCASAVIGRLRGGDTRPGAPSRILLISVLSVVLLVPALFRGAARALRDDVRSQISEWVGRDAAIESTLDESLTRLATDPYIGRQIADARRDPSELAFYVWLALGFDKRESDGALVLVRDASGRRISRFSMNAPPARRLPYYGTPPRPIEGTDVVMERRPGSGEILRAIAGHLSVRGNDGTLLGTVSVFVADPLAVELAGAEPRIPVRPTRPGGEAAERPARPLSLRLVADGRVVATNDLEARPTLPSALPPAERLSEPRWIPAESPDLPPILAVDAGSRGILVAEPRREGASEILFGVARVMIVGVGAGVVVACLALAFGLRRYRARLQDRILASYFVISVVPLVFLGLANWRDASSRAEDEFRRRQDVLVRTARDDFRIVLSGATPGSDDGYDQIQTEAVALYRRGELDFTGLRDLVTSELLPERLSSDAYRALELDQRDTYVETTRVGGTSVRTAYAPMQSPDGTQLAIVAVPVRYDSTRAEQQASETGSVLLAAYLLTLVLVVVIGIYTARRLARPLQALVEGTRRVAAGELGTAIPGAGRDEMGQLVEGFNSMTHDLAATRDLAARAEREAAWRGMARQVAHEIKNPLTPMKLLLQQLAATAGSDPQFAVSMIEPTSKVVLEQIDALSRIASDFAAFARFPPRALRDCDVNEVLRSVIALYGTGSTGTTEIRHELEDGLPSIRWDEDELRRVFVNLVANAVQSLDEAKGVVKVLVRSSRAPMPGSGRPAILVTVADDGVGIPPENHARLFEPDFSTKTHGTGLGLAICRRIVTDLSGEIRIDSQPGVGTSVSTWLPLPTGNSTEG